MQISSLANTAFTKPPTTDATAAGVTRTPLDTQASSLKQALAYIKTSDEIEDAARIARAKQKLEDAKAQLEFLRRWSFSPEVVARQAAALGQQVAAAANDFAASGDLVAAGTTAVATTADTNAPTPVSADAPEDDTGYSIAQQAYDETMRDGMERSTPSSEESEILEEFKALAEEIRRLLQEALRKMQQEQNAERADASDAIATLGDQIGRLTAILGTAETAGATMPRTITL
ncbi:hypothetical protein LJR030_005142 [Rhizobium sp. LjRoot30]|uniref:hypothetical protein n=1 Tax=Rhizobium sp. LjRoot30 TaxID=3342320 RepID=UPI003ECDD811